jgi:hypothetical protein
MEGTTTYQILQALKELTEHMAGFSLTQLLLGHDQVEQLTLWS